MKKFLLAFAACASVVLYNSCTKDVADPKITVDCSTIDSATYTYKVKDIIDGYCGDQAGCHTASSLQGNLNLETYDLVKGAVESKDLLCRIQYGGGCGDGMPESGKMADSLINTIICWSEAGFPQ